MTLVAFSWDQCLSFVWLKTDAFISTDSEQRIFFFNGGADQVLRYGRDEAAKKPRSNARSAPVGPPGCL